MTHSINDPRNAALTDAATIRLTVVVEDNFPPFVQQRDGRGAGLAIDALDALARQSGIDLEYLSAPAASIPAILAEGKADAVFPLAINADRLALYDFSDPVLFTGGGFFVAAPSLSPFGLDQLHGKKIATPATGPLAGYIRANAPAAQLILTKDYIEPLRMIVTGEADAAALNLEAGRILVGNLYAGRITVPSSHFHKLPLALGIPKDNKKKLPILQRLNTAIQRAAALGVDI